MQHPIGDHALLADGRTAALLDPDGNVAWMCWPRVDSAPLFRSLLDTEHGGGFTVGPVSPAARVVSRRYHAGSLVLETVWRVGHAQLVVDDALAWEGDARLVRRLHARSGDVEVAARCAVAGDPGAAVSPHAIGNRLTVINDGGARVAVVSPGAWALTDRAATSRFVVDAAAGPVSVTLGPADAAQPAPQDTVETTVAAWRRLLPDMSRATLSQLAVESLGETRTRELASISAAVLLGLRQRGGGIVAAPTTSLPQWPGSGRTWDYRFCWLRDASLAGLAALRAGLVDTAIGIGEFVGEAAGESWPSALVRVDGGAAPGEQLRADWTGYRGARPVRFGNAAALQLQLDVPGEIVELAWELARTRPLPEALAASVAKLADWTAANWRRPDHGIWEIRGRPRQYTHSRVLAWAALHGAARLASQGRVRGDRERWQRAADAARAAVLRPGAPALLLHQRGGGADAALALAGHIGFLRPDDPLLLATLELIASRLDRGGLIDRYEGQPDRVSDPCAPFVFPTFWLAMARHQSGRDGSRHFAAAATACSPLGLFGEVADPRDHSPLGNYPQTQSHASFLLAALSE